MWLAHIKLSQQYNKVHDHVLSHVVMNYRQELHR